MFNDIAIDNFKQCPGQTSGKALYARILNRESELLKLIAHRQPLQVCRCSCMKITSQATLQSALTEYATPHPGTLSLQQEAAAAALQVGCSSRKSY